MAKKKEDEEKPDSVIPFIIAFAIVSVIAVATGWFISSGQLAAVPEKQLAEMDNTKKEEKAKKDEADEKKVSQPGNQVVKLAPIIVKLVGGLNTWLRIELVVIANQDSDLESAGKKELIANDITAFLRTLSLNQISSPSGYLHLKEDLLDRANLSTAGNALDVLIVTMVTE